MERRAHIVCPYAALPVVGRGAHSAPARTPRVGRKKFSRPTEVAYSYESVAVRGGSALVSHASPAHDADLSRTTLP
ncbi:MAG: hypothetical protein VB071_10780 [Lawsonibacter sp.]|nr:hypothetical protein [Lawsonibacter sp.]